MASTDPTNTTTLRRRYGSRLRGQLGKLMAAIRDGIVTEDVFLLQNEPKAPSDQEPYQFPRQQGQIRAFMDWLRKQISKGFLQVVNPESNVFIKAAYEQGVNGARRRLDVETPEPDFSLPTHQRALRELFTRNYELLQDVTEDMSREIRDELTEGLRDGDHSSKIASEISDRVQKVGKHRATVISRTEVINAYSEGSLQQYKDVDVEQVTLEAEVLTAQDERVCEICKAVEAMGVFSLDRIENGVVSKEQLQTYADDDVSLPDTRWNPKPPIHPQCRCTLLPVR